MPELTDLELVLFNEMKQVAEGSSDDGWKDVYLDNLSMRSNTPHVFAGSLRRKGLYKPVDDAWGQIKLHARQSPQKELTL